MPTLKEEREQELKDEARETKLQEEHEELLYEDIGYFCATYEDAIKELKLKHQYLTEELAKYGWPSDMVDDILEGMYDE